MKEAFIVMAAVAVFIAAVFGIAMLIGYGVNLISCNRYGLITGREVRVDFPVECYVKTDKGWFSRDQIRNI